MSFNNHTKVDVSFVKLVVLFSNDASFIWTHHGYKAK